MDVEYVASGLRTELRPRLSGFRPLVSIVIPNFNSGRLLADCVNSIRQYTKDYEIIIVDNYSTDGSLDSLEKGSDLRGLRVPGGFSFANNVGIMNARGCYVVLLNSDCIVTPRWLDRLVETAEQSRSIGIVTSKMVRPSGQLDTTGILYSYETGVAKPRGIEELDRGQYDDQDELVAAEFACVLVKKEVFSHVGLIDEKIIAYFSDLDFCIRARLAGWRIVYCPSSVVYHYRFGSTGPTRKRWLAGQSRPSITRIILKNYELKPAISHVLVLVRGMFAGVKNRRQDWFKDRVRIVAWNIIHFPLSERIRAQSTRKLRDREVFSEEG